MKPHSAAVLALAALLLLPLAGLAAASPDQATGPAPSSPPASSDAPVLEEAQASPYLPGEQLIEWGGSLRWLASNAAAQTVRERIAKLGGHATLFRGGDKAAGVFHPLSAPLLGIHKRLKATFDPHGVFNHGRMYGDF